MSISRFDCPQFQQFLEFLNENNAVLNTEDDMWLGYTLNCVEIRLLHYPESRTIRAGIDYVGYWNKYYDCMVGEYFPMSRRDWLSLKRQLKEMIADKSKGRNHYRTIRKRKRQRCRKANKKWVLRAIH